jgi:hypothetical protein
MYAYDFWSLEPLAITFFSVKTPLIVLDILLKASVPTSSTNKAYKSFSISPMNSAAPSVTDSTLSLISS